VVPDPVQGTEANWTLGQPANSLQSAAHSGTNVWGTDLTGQARTFTFISTFIYGPVIDLAGLKSATLYFWDSADPGTSGNVEMLQLGILTNSSTPPNDIPTYQDFTAISTPDWSLEPVDLTPFVGQTIQVVWFYEGFCVAPPMNGWLIDDISITGVTAGGTVKISKNLGQGSYALSSLSPIGLVPVQSGFAPTVTISNLPVGAYVLQLGDVPYYQTPADQTNTLTAGGTLNFSGTYTFLDLNHNGISDAWEMDYFGTVVTNRTAATDTDHDGMSDYAEFIAGTNPTNAASRFYFTGESSVSNHLVSMHWTVATNRLYQINTSSNLMNWTPLTGWLQATDSPTMTYTATNTGIRGRFYRVQVQP